MSILCKNDREDCCYLSPHDHKSCLNQGACEQQVEGNRTGSEILEGFIKGLNPIEREALTRYLEEKPVEEIIRISTTSIDPSIMRSLIPDGFYDKN